MQDPKHCSLSLVQLLLGQLTSPNVAPITRSAAAAYMASFLARAALVPENVLIEALQVRPPLLSISPFGETRSMQIASMLASLAAQLSHVMCSCRSSGCPRSGNAVRALTDKKSYRA